MLRLFASELLRARSRRLIPVMLVGCLLGSVVGMTIAAFQSEKPTQEQLDHAQRQVDQAMEQCLDGRFFGSQGEYPSSSASLEEACQDSIRVESYLRDGAMELSQLPETVRGVAFVIVLLGLVIGASLVGAELSAGTMATLLAWEARRTRVLLTRAVVTVLVTAVMTALVLVAFSALYALATMARGITVAPGVMGQTVEAILRVVTAAVIGSLIAMSLATVVRSTAGGLGILLGYAILVEGFLRGLIHDLPRILFISNTIVFVSGKPQSITQEFGRHPDLTTPNEAFAVMAVWVAVLVAFAVLAFRSRDVN